MKTSYFANGFSSFFSYFPLLSYIWCPCFISCYDRPWLPLTTPQFRVCGNGKYEWRARERDDHRRYIPWVQYQKRKNNEKTNTTASQNSAHESSVVVFSGWLFNKHRTNERFLYFWAVIITLPKKSDDCCVLESVSCPLSFLITPQQHRSIRRSSMIVRISISCLKTKCRPIYCDRNGVINIRVHAVLLKLISAWERNFLKRNWIRSQLFFWLDDPFQW